MNTHIDSILLEKAQTISDWVYVTLGIDNFSISKIFFAPSVIFLLSGASVCMSNGSMDAVRGICTFLALSVVASFFTAADRGNVLDSGHIGGISIPFSYKIITFEWLRPYCMLLVCIASGIFLYACLFEDYKKYVAGVSLHVWVRGFDLISSTLVMIGIYFLSCEKKKKRTKEYEVYA